MENFNFNKLGQSSEKLIDKVIIDDEEEEEQIMTPQSSKQKSSHTLSEKIYLPPSKMMKHGGIEEHLEFLSNNNKKKNEELQSSSNTRELLPSLISKKKLTEPESNFSKKYYLDENEFKDIRQTVDDLRRLLLQSKSIQDRMIIKTEKIQNDLDPTKEKINWSKIVK